MARPASSRRSRVRRSAPRVDDDNGEMGVGFLVIAIIAGVLGLAGIASVATGIAKILFYIALALFVIFIIVGFFLGQLVF